MLMPLQARAAGMDIGMSTWFCWWEPSWNNEGAGFKINPAFFYGPGLAFRLPANITISTGFLYARVKAETPRGIQVFVNNSRVINRYDSDSTIGYSFTMFFRLFAGFKYSHYSYLVENIAYTIMILKEKTKYNEYAPALGVGFTIKLIDQLYLLIHVSTVYMFCDIKTKSRTYSGLPNFDLLINLFNYLSLKSGSVHKLGANSQLALAYFIQPISIAISLGFRYQVFGVVKKDSIVGQFSEYPDHFYGITASMIYRIDFPNKKDIEGYKEK